MAIGTAAIGLGLSAVGGALSSRSASRAASRAADVSAQNTAETNALNREIYGQNREALSPFMQRGNVAGDTYNALLGLGVGTSPQVATGYQGAYPDSTGYQPYGGMNYSSTPNAFNWRMQAISPNDMIANYAPQQASTTANVSNITPQEAAQNAFDIYRGSTGYDWRLKQGMNAVNSGWAGAGLARSGDAAKSALEYGQGFASNEFANYMGYLGNQQGVGLAGASALAGVGQNYANNVGANNAMNAANQANAALVRGNNNPFASALGTLGGGILGSL